jgi:hypothetical protein
MIPTILNRLCNKWESVVLFLKTEVDVEKKTLGNSLYCIRHYNKCRRLDKNYHRRCDAVDIDRDRCYPPDLDDKSYSELVNMIPEYRLRYSKFSHCYNSRMHHRNQCIHKLDQNIGHNQQFTLLEGRIKECDESLAAIYQKGEYLRGLRHEKELLSQEQDLEEDYHDEELEILHKADEEPEEMSDAEFLEYYIQQARTEIDPKVSLVYELLGELSRTLGNPETPKNVLRVIMTIVAQGQDKRTFQLKDLQEIARRLDKGETVDLFEQLMKLQPATLKYLNNKLQNRADLIIEETPEDFVEMTLRPESYFDSIYRSKTPKDEQEEKVKKGLVALILSSLKKIIRQDIRDIREWETFLISDLVAYKMSKTRSEIIPELVRNNNKLEDILKYYFNVNELRQIYALLLRDGWKQYSSLPQRVLVN